MKRHVKWAVAHPSRWFHIAGLCCLIGGSQLRTIGAGTAEENWPNWRGPLANGTAPKAHPPLRWSETNHVKWKVKIPGRGTASPIIWDNQVFLQTAIPTGRKPDMPVESKDVGIAPTNASAGGPPRGAQPNELYQFVLLCLDRQTGKTLWSRAVREELPHEGHHPDHGFASYSTVTDGDRLYAWFGSRGLYCFDLDGNLKWQKDLGRFQIKNAFGEGGSPALYQDKLVIKCDHEGEDFIVVLDKASGRELWRQTRDEDTSWSSPLVVQRGTQIEIVTTASRKIRSYDWATGKLLWECGGLTANVIPSPVFDGERVYVTSGFRGNAMLALQLGRSGDLTGTDGIAWKLSKNTPYVPSPLLYNGRLYFFSGNNGILSVVEASTGKILLDGRKIDALSGVYASPVAADGRVYLTGRNGSVVVIKESDPETIIHTNHLQDGFDASPALAGDDLFLRGREYFYCLSGQ
jgi:outer membrane protein assembly factor BamB